MTNISKLQDTALTLMKQAMQVSAVALKYPFPVRPGRMLGLIRLDGQVFSSEKVTRAVFMQIGFPAFMKVYSTFIFPKIEYDLPVFSCETILMGKKRVFVVDAHKSGAGGEQQHNNFFDRLMEIRKRYPELTGLHKASRDGIASLQSQAAVRVTMPRTLDEQASGIFSEYFSAYLDLVKSAEPLSGIARAKLQASFDDYLKTVVDHDPGVKGNIMFFGKKEGIERALDMFYGV